MSNDNCPTCKGSGVASGKHGRCDDCGGTGKK